MVKISYGITVHKEAEELQKLLDGGLSVFYSYFPIPTFFVQNISKLTKITLLPAAGAAKRFFILLNQFSIQFLINLGRFRQVKIVDTRNFPDSVPTFFVLSKSIPTKR